MKMRMATNFIRYHDFIWNTNMSRNLDTNLARNLMRALYRPLVTMSILFGKALRFVGITQDRLRFSMSFTLLLSVANMGVCSNKNRRMVYLGVSCVATGSKCFFTLLNVGCVYNSFANRAMDLAFSLDWLLVALYFFLFMTLRLSGLNRLAFPLTISMTIKTTCESRPTTAELW